MIEPYSVVKKSELLSSGDVSSAKELSINGFRAFVFEDDDSGNKFAVCEKNYDLASKLLNGCKETLGITTTKLIGNGFITGNQVFLWLNVFLYIVGADGKEYDALVNNDGYAYIVPHLSAVENILTSKQHVLKFAV